MPEVPVPLRPHQKNGTEVTIGFGPHYLEAIPMLVAHMHECDTILLEEPQTTGFIEMLQGDVAVDTY